MKTVPLTVLLCVVAGVACAQNLQPALPAAAHTLSAVDKNLVPLAEDSSASIPTKEAASSPLPPNDGLLKLPSFNDPGAQKAAQLLEEMLTALGGQRYLDLQNMEQQGRTYSFYHGESSGAGIIFWRFWKWPDKERVELTKKRDWYITYNGDHGYETTFRGTSEVETKALEDFLRRRQHSLPWILRKWLRQPGVALFYEGSAMAERKQADQVSILNAQNDGVIIYLDTATHLPLKIAFTWRDPKTRDRTEEAEGYDAYRSVQGIMTPFNITRYRDGEMVNQRFITETKYNQSLAESLFDAQTRSALEKPKKN